MKTGEQVVYEMLTENTGQAMCDSGGAYGRHHEKNRGKTLADFQKEPEVTVGSADCYTISLFHYLTQQLDRDRICEEFDEINKAAKDWDDERFYGVSAKAGDYLDLCDMAPKIRDGFNSYNGQSSLSQVIQGTYISLRGKDYIILQIHGGCDVRGGYTDARLFLMPDGTEGYLQIEDVCGIQKSVYQGLPMLPGIPEPRPRYCSNRYDGHTLRWDNQDGRTGLELTDEEIATCQFSLSIDC